MKHAKTIAILCTATMLAACTEPNGAPGRGIENGGALSKTDVAVVVGAVGGGAIGATMGAGIGEVATIIGGTLIGGALGEVVGKSLDNADLASYNQASQRAMETGQTETWQNGDNHGAVHPHKRYKNENGDTCREYTQTIYIGKEKHTGHGTACRNADGAWQIVE